MGKVLRLRTIFFVTLVFIAILHCVSSIPSILSAWSDYQDALRVEGLNQVENLLFQAVRNYGFERGRVNVVLNDAGPVEAMEANRNFILERRREGDSALSRALVEIPQYQLPKTDPIISRIRAMNEEIQKMRERISGEMLLPLAERNRNLPKAWFPAMTSLIKAIEDLLVVVSRDISDRDGYIARLSSVKHRALALRNTSGPEMSILSATILSGKPLPLIQKNKIEKLLVKTDLNWEFLDQLLVEIDDARVTSAYQHLRDVYFNQYSPKKMKVFPASLTGGPYPYTQPEFLGTGVKALEAIAGFMDAVVAMTNDYAESKRVTASGSLIRHSISLVVSLFLIILALFIVNNRVAKPIERVTEVMNRLSNGDLEVDIPKVRYKDEIGEMTKAVRVFKQNAIQVEEDIIAIRNIESELRKSRESLATGQQIANLGNWDFDIEKNHKTWSDQVYRILGFAPGEIDPETYDLEIVVVDEDLERFRRYNDLVFNEFASLDLTYSIRQKSGKRRIIHELCQTMRDEAGNPVRIIGVIHDVTEQKKLETQVQQAQKLESLGIVAGGIAHDFNNLLMGVIGNAELLMMDLTKSGRENQRVERIIEVAKRAADIAKQMLAYSGQDNFTVQAVDINESSENLTNLIQSTVSKKALIYFDFQQNLPTIDGDPSQISQVILNLLTNASEALGDDPGEITVRTYSKICSLEDLKSSYLFEGQKPGEYVAFEVADTGAGIPRQDMENIFDPFFSTKFTGRGLGLASVLGITRGHNGAIMVKSTPGKGSVFTVLFPVGKLKEVIGRHPPKQVESDNLKGLALVVDDEPHILDIAGQLLSSKGMDVLLAENGVRSLEVYLERHQDIQLVLLDMTMPDMNGDVVVQKMKEIDDSVPIVLSSGYSKEILTNQLDALDIAGFLEKPYRSDQLFNLISNVLAEQKSSAADSGAPA